MAKFVLEEDEKEITLYGVASHSKPYQLIFALNQHSDISFTHANSQLSLGELPKVVHNHPYYLLNDDNLECQLYLIVNFQNGRYLAPQLKHAHYLLLTESNNHFRIKEIIDKIKHSKGVLTIFDLNKLTDKKLKDEIRLWVN